MLGFFLYFFAEPQFVFFVYILSGLRRLFDLLQSLTLCALSVIRRSSGALKSLTSFFVHYYCEETGGVVKEDARKSRC